LVCPRRQARYRPCEASPHVWGVVTTLDSLHDALLQYHNGDKRNWQSKMLSDGLIS
jgi:hypothetical protein